MRLFLWALSWILLGLLPLYSTAQQDTLTNISNAFGAFSDTSSNQNRRALLDALAVYDGPPTVMTVNAHLTVMMHDAPSKKYRRIAESADAARKHLEPISATLPKQYLDARFMAAIARFNAYDDANAVLEMAHVHGKTQTMRGEEIVWDDWAKTLHYRAFAWTEAMQASRALSGATKTSIKNQVEDILSTYANPLPQTKTSDQNQLEFCDGEMKYPRKISYPTRAIQRGKFGSIVLGYGFDEEGRVINAEVLASVPVDTFDKESLKWIKSAYFKPADKDQVGVTCRLNRTNITQTLTFSLG